MIDLSSLKQPAWSKVVSELAAPAGDDRAYLERLLSVLGQVSAAKQAVLFLPGAGTSGEMQARVLSVWPPMPANAKEPVVEEAKDVKAAALAAIESVQSRAFGLGESDGMYGAEQSGKGYVLALPLVTDSGSGQRASAACVTLLLEPRGKAAVQSTLAMAEVLCGYVNIHAGRQEVKRMHQSAMSLELASRLLSAVNAAPNFKGAALRLVNDLTRQFGADRAALGWVNGSCVEVAALSDAENFDKRMKMIRDLQRAMDECLDQEQAVLVPVPTEGQDVLLAQAISASHRELIGGDPLLTVCSVPVRGGGKDDPTLGVLTVELKRKPGGGGTEGGGLDLRGVEILQAAMDLVGPVLAVKRAESAPVPMKLAAEARRVGAWAVGPRHTWWKLAGVLAIAAFVFVALFTIEHRVGAKVTLEPRTKRTISVPFEGVIGSIGAGVEPGKIVKAGDVIFEMDTRELLLQRDAQLAKMQQAEKQISQARRDEKVADEQLAQAAWKKASAEKMQIDARLSMARLVSPIDGTIIAGDLKDKLGASVKAGDELFQIAPMNELIAVARVDERDVGLIAAGGKGEVATKARPGQPLAMTIETIVPLAVAREGSNEFEVRGSIDAANAGEWVRPGMEGEARLNAGKRTLLWIGTRRLIDAVRLWWW